MLFASVIKVRHLRWDTPGPQMPSSVLERDRGSRFDSHSESKEKTKQRYEGYEGAGLEAWRGSTGAEEW